MDNSFEGEGGAFPFSDQLWPKVLELARRYSWKPQGTRRYLENGEIDTNWEGGYLDNCGQTISSEDAANLAQALEDALPDVPNHSAIEPEHTVVIECGPEGELPDDYEELIKGKMQIIFQLPDGSDLYVIPPRYFDLMNPLEALSGEGKEYVRQFIAFCRQGEFRLI